MTTPTSALDASWDAPPPFEDLLRAAMAWHFGDDTGSAFWLERRGKLGFDPRTDVRTEDDLARFPNLVDELRAARIEDLIPRGYGRGRARPNVYESGGTTGAPKRIPWLGDLERQLIAWQSTQMDAHGVARDVNWLILGPSGPHMFGDVNRALAHHRGGIAFLVDLDPRWAKRCSAEGRVDEVKRYVEHVLDQTEWVLDSQDIGVLFTTPPLLNAIAGRDRLCALVGRKVRTIVWGGASMDVDTRHLLRTEVFPGVQLIGFYGSTMVGGGMFERIVDDPAALPTFDPPTPFISMRVIDGATGQRVPYGERGQVVMHHVSRSLLIPNNLERDTAIRIAPAPGSRIDGVADIKPVASFGGKTVVEGVY